MKTVKDAEIFCQYIAHEYLGTVSYTHLDVIIDFSHPNNLNDILTYALANQTKLVIATTGYSQEQLDQIKEASKEIAIFQSYNTSFGVQMVTKMLRQFAKEFYDAGYDIEILEKHHNQKIDAPSGTAELLLSLIHISYLY